MRGDLHEHGGNVYLESRCRGLRIEQLVDFSANINPLGPSPLALEAIQSSLDLVRHYPDPDCTELTEELATYLQVDPGMIVVGNGGAEVIQLVADVLGAHTGLVLSPTFSEYARAIQRAGGRAIPVAFEDFDAHLDGIDVVFLCNPNNPTGSIMPRCRVLDIVHCVQRCGATVVVDEAFMDFVENADSYTARGDVGDGANLIVVGSLTKFFAIPGLRVGYAVAPEQLASKLREAKQTWSVNCLAQAAAVASLRDVDYIVRTREYVAREREFLLEGLAELAGVHGFRVWPPAANYILISVAPDSPTAGEVRRRMAESGLLLRDCSNFPLLDDRSVRIAVRTRNENKRLLSELGRVLTVSPARR